jgi:phosphate transport system substrate-binding protein
MNWKHLCLCVCGGVLVSTGVSFAADALEGAGATFPYPLYQKWIAAFLERTPGLTIRYRPVGSGAGMEMLKSNEVDFAASDAPLSDEELSALSRRVVHIPAVVGGVVPIYHLEGSLRDLRFTPQILAGIYLGKIKRWNDPQIQAANRGVRFPARDIAVVHRSDGSGTTYVWTDYLAKVSEEWRTSIGSSTKVPWPAGTGATGNEGVAETVRNTPDSIGYVEFIYALQAHLSYGSVRNASGRFVQADLVSLPAAAASFSALSKSADLKDFRFSITNARGTQAYPIAAFTYFLVPEKFASPEKARTMTQFLRWALTSGQKQCAALGYAALPDEIAKRALEAAGGIE